MYVPPTLGSLIFAKNAIQATNIEYKQTFKQNKIISKQIKKFFLSILSPDNIRKLKAT